MKGCEQMTLCVAAKVPSKRLNPKRRPLRFIEKGLVLVADTRFTYPPGPRVIDDAQKLWWLADWVIAGYAGDVEIAEPALLSVHNAIEHHGWRKSVTIALAVKNYLRYWHRKVSDRRRATSVDVLLGIRSGNSRFRLYWLNSANGYRVQERDGIFQRGSGADSFKKAIEVEIDHFTSQWSAPARSGYKLEDQEGRVACVPRKPSDLVDVRLIDVECLLMGTVDLIVQKAGLADVGGLTQVLALTKDGVYSPKGKRLGAVDGRWHDLTTRDVRSNLHIAQTRYKVPYMDGNCQIQGG